jgi:hypothetical protein
MTKYLRISSYIRKPFLVYDFATAPSVFSFIWRIFFLLYEWVLCCGRTPLLRAKRNCAAFLTSHMPWYGLFCEHMAADLCSNSRPLWKDRMCDWRSRWGPPIARAFFTRSPHANVRAWCKGRQSWVKHDRQNEGSRYWQDRPIKTMLTGPGKIRPLMKKQNAAKKRQGKDNSDPYLSNNSFLSLVRRM